MLMDHGRMPLTARHKTIWHPSCNEDLEVALTRR